MADWEEESEMAADWEVKVVLGAQVEILAADRGVLEEQVEQGPWVEEADLVGRTISMPIDWQAAGAAAAAGVLSLERAGVRG